MKNFIFLILFSALSITGGFAMDNSRNSEWDLNNPCAYHTLSDSTELSYGDILTKAQNLSGPKFAKEWAVVNKAKQYFSQATYNLGVEGFTQLPHDQRLDFGDNDFKALRNAQATLKQFFATLNWASLGLSPTNAPASRGYNTLMHDLDFALTILYVNAKGYIGSLD
jgi:hypothetical protein